VGQGLTVRAALLSLSAIALLLLAAHFFHAQVGLVAALCILLIALLFVPRAWAGRLVQVVLAAGAVEWILTAYTLADMRMQRGQPYLRLVVILGAVALLTALAAAAFQHPALRSRFGFGASRTPDATG
jgi:hypothetical protein